MPLLAALLLSPTLLAPTLLAPTLLAPTLRTQTPMDPYAEATALLKEMRTAKSVEVRHVDGDAILARRAFANDPKRPSAGSELLAAMQGDFLKARNDTLPMCGFHADVALVTKGKRTLKAEFCFGCGVVQVEIPGPPMRRQLSWLMNDRDAMRRAVWAIYPGVKLGK